MAADSTDREYTIRIVGIYATKWRYLAASRDPDVAAFNETRLEAFVDNFVPVLPRLPQPIAAHEFASDDIRFSNPLDVTVTGGDMFLFVLPSDQVVAAFTIDCRTTDVSVDPAPAAEMLDEFADDAFTIRGLPLTTYLTNMAPIGTRPYEESRDKLRARHRWLFRRDTVEEATPGVELAERHQIIYVSSDDRLSPAIVDKMLYRRQPRLWKEFTQRKEPTELNERGQRGVVTTNASLIQGHDPMLEDSVFLATVQAVGTLSRFRQIWDYAYDVVRRFRQDNQRDETGVQEREDLHDLVDRLGNLEFDLTFSVEFPLMRIESYHSALSDVLDLDGQSNRLSRMFDQLDGSVRSEITAIDIRESRKADGRRRRYEFAINTAAVVALPVGVLLAFFGISTKKNVNDSDSIFYFHTFRVEYLAAIGLGLLPVVVLSLVAIATPLWRRRRQRRRERGLQKTRESLGQASSRADLRRRRTATSTHDGASRPAPRPRPGDADGRAQTRSRGRTDSLDPSKPTLMR